MFSLLNLTYNFLTYFLWRKKYLILLNVLTSFRFLLYFPLTQNFLLNKLLCQYYVQDIWIYRSFFFFIYEGLMKLFNTFKINLKIVGQGYYFLVTESFLTKSITVYCGTSHFKNLVIPATILVKIYGRKKKLISLKGYNLIFLTHFAQKLFNFAKPDIYRGKGLRFFKQKFKLKKGKKKFI
jgi:hypothetical protein